MGIDCQLQLCFQVTAQMLVYLVEQPFPVECGVRLNNGLKIRIAFQRL